MSSLTFDLPRLNLYPQRSDPTLRWWDKLWLRVSGPVVQRLPGTISAARFVQRVGALEKELQAEEDSALRLRVATLQCELRQSSDDQIVQGFALVREVCRRRLGKRHYDVQLRAALDLLHGHVVEMDTGEGKTLAAAMAAIVAALAGTPVHIVTVNDYLAARDAEELRPLYEFFGLTVGTIVHGLAPAERRAAYQSDIVYASNKEITFDYLRDRMAMGNRWTSTGFKLKRLLNADEAQSVVMRGLHFAIVDEADSVLIDEARTPLIISRRTNPKDERELAAIAWQLVDELTANEDFEIIEEDRRVSLTAQGKQKLAEQGTALGGIWMGVVRREEAARQALSAKYLYQAGDHYIVQDDKIVIVDEYTGRVMPERSWSDGLHQIIEFKEDVTVTGRNVPIARLTYQRFFRRYCRLAGLTGTAREIRQEAWEVYRLRVSKVPPNRPRQRRTLPTKIHGTQLQKWDAIATRVRLVTETGRPVLIGTRSVEASEDLSARLSEHGIEHVVLNAVKHEDEAEIIARAGELRRVTVATNMAGRGVDIKPSDEVVDLGGLHVILSERHDAARIDRQLEGRCGRQGDPGTTECILSLQDKILELVTVPAWLVERFESKGGTKLHTALGKLLLRTAQRRAERVHRRIRNALLEADEKQANLLAFSGGME